MVREEIGDRVFATVEDFREVVVPALGRFWNDAAAVLRLVGCNLDQSPSGFVRSFTGLGG